MRKIIAITQVTLDGAMQVIGPAATHVVATEFRTDGGDHPAGSSVPAERIATAAAERGIPAAVRSDAAAAVSDAVEEAADAAPVALINQTFAERFFPSADPLGRHIRLGRSETDPLVRIVGVVDTLREVDGRAVRSWGWCYRTLEGHLERGEMTFQVRKWLDTGDVEFRIDRYFMRGPMPNPVIRLGWAVFGHWMQVRFVRRSLRRMTGLVTAELRRRGATG